MIHVEAEDGVALVRFDRPPANAIELESARALEAPAAAKVLGEAASR